MTQHSLAAGSGNEVVHEEVPMSHDLRITAASVTIIDRNGVRVPAGPLSSVIRVLSDRKHNRPPVVHLATSHTETPNSGFEEGKWLLANETFTRYTGPRNPTYTFEYADFVVSIPGQGDARARSRTLAPILAAAQRYADTTDSLVVLDSPLPGFIPTVMSPQAQSAAPPAAQEDIPTEAMALIPPKPHYAPPRPDEITHSDRTSPPPSDRRRTRKRRVPTSLRAALLHRRVSRLSTAVIARIPRPSRSATATVSGVRRKLAGVRINRKRAVALTAATAAAALTAAGGIALITSSAPPPSDDQPIAAAPVVTASDADLLSGYTEAWTLPPEKTEALSWFTAGLAYVDPDSGEFILADPTSGDEIASVDLDSAIDYTAEFTVGDTPAVGARTEEGFTALTADGETQSWPLTEDDVLRVSGTTPMLIRDGDAFALTVNESDPVPVTGNPELRPAAIDGDEFFQIAAGQPRLATLSRSGDAEATETTLAPPTPTARFDRHLTVGHGLALTQWSDGSSSTLVIHDTDTGDATATITNPADVSGWSLGRGMQTLVVGDHIIDVSTGHVLASTDDVPFSTAIGPAAVIDSGSQRHYIVDGHSYTTQAGRVIGYDGEGLAVVRNTDGSVTTMILDPEETS